MNRPNHFEPDVVYEVFKKVWARSTPDVNPREETEDTEIVEVEPPAVVGANVAIGPSKRPRLTTANANANALKLTCELLKLFVSETIQRAAMVAEAEGSTQIEGSHLERILPQLLLDF